MSSFLLSEVTVPKPEAGLDALVERFQLGSAARTKLSRLLGILVNDPLAPTTIRDERRVLEDHLADSLIALDYAYVRSARAALDLGSGAGLPGLPLAIALPEADFTLLESSSRKCRFLRQAIDVCQVPNARVAHARAESFATGRGSYDLVVARAVASPQVTAEYAAPLLRPEGVLVLWRGRRDVQAETALSRAAVELGLGEAVVKRVRPYAGAEHRHLYALSKVTKTPSRFPRRPGIALKRPLGA